MAPFTIFFGDYNHGLWITWESIDSYGAGIAAFKATFQANYRARMYTWANTVAGDTVTAKDYDYQPVAATTAGGAAWAT